MIGSAPGGTDVEPRRCLPAKGPLVQSLRGMGSIGAMERGSADRYFQDEIRTP